MHLKELFYLFICEPDPLAVEVGESDVLGQALPLEILHRLPVIFQVLNIFFCFKTIFLWETLHHVSWTGTSSSSILGLFAAGSWNHSGG